MNTAEKVLEALKPFDLKLDGKNKYRSNSPIRPGSNSHAFALTIDDGEHGAYHDHVSGDSGSLYDLAKLLHIETPKAAVSSTKRVYAGIKDYADAHGIPLFALQNARWHEVTKDNRHALEYPTRTGTRWRFLDGSKPFYKSEKGYQRCWYGLTAATLRLVAAGQPLIICNGEISVISGQYYGLAAVAVTGGENVIPPELLVELQGAVDAKTRIIVALDCDKKGVEAAQKLTAQLRAAGFNARAVNLELSSGGDLADYCMLHGGGGNTVDLAALPDLPDGTPQTIRRSWVIVKAKDLKFLPKVTWLVTGEIPEKGLTVIYGPSGIGKSFLALDYALKIAQVHTVVYVAAEGQSGYEQRIAAWCQHNRQTEDNLYICLGSPNLMEDDDLETFIAEVVSLSPALVIVDTLAMAMIGGDENSARDMGRIIQSARSIQLDADCAVVFVHHTNKGGVIERGSSALRGASDVMIRVSGDDDLVVVEAAKVKDAAPFETRYMKLLPVQLEDGESRVMIPAEKLIQQPGDPLTRNQRKVLESMSLEVFEDGASFSDLAEMTEIGRGAVQRVLSALARLGYVERSKAGESYKVSAAGRAAATGQTDSADSVVTPSFSPLTRLNHTSQQKSPFFGVTPADSTESTESPSQVGMFDQPVRNNYHDGY